jgi:hypothetical protein
MLVHTWLSIGTGESVDVRTCPVGSAVVETFYGLRDSRDHVAAGQDTDLTMAAEGKLVLIRVITTVTHEFTLHCE